MGDETAANFGVIAGREGHAVSQLGRDSGPHQQVVGVAIEAVGGEGSPQCHEAGVDHPVIQGKIVGPACLDFGGDLDSVGGGKGPGQARPRVLRKV